MTNKNPRRTKGYIQAASEAWKEKEARWIKKGDFILFNGKALYIEDVDLLLSIEGEGTRNQIYIPLNKKVDVAQKGSK
jgi:hypothetical protein